MKDQRRTAEWYEKQAAHAAKAIAQCDRTPTSEEVAKAFRELFGRPRTEQGDCSDGW